METQEFLKLKSEISELNEMIRTNEVALNHLRRMRELKLALLNKVEENLYEGKAAGLAGKEPN